MVVCENPSRSAVCEILRPVRLHQQPFHVQSLKSLSSTSDARFELHQVVFTTSRCLSLKGCGFESRSAGIVGGGGGVNVQRSLHLQYHDWGALEQGTEPPTAPQAPQNKWLPTALGVCSQCVSSLLCVCECVCVWVCTWMDKCRVWIPSMGHHTWLYVTFTSLNA